MGELEEFLEHYGVQGMKWGQRKAANKANVARLRKKGLSKRKAKNTNRYQNNIDAQRMVAAKRNGEVNVLRRLNNRAISNQMLSLRTIAKHPLSTEKAAQTQLKKNIETQSKIANGEKKATAALLRFQGISIADINYAL